MLRRPPRADGLPDPVPVVASETRVASRAFPKFLGALAGRDHLTIIDVGPVVGSNLDFFAARAACKIYIEDLFTDVERHAQAGTRAKLPSVLPPRSHQAAASVDAGPRRSPPSTS